jgi:hypothetical protein
MRSDGPSLRTIDGRARTVMALDAVEAETREAMLGERFEVRRRYGFDWTPLFAARRAAWHALDHAWELEDRLPG